MMSFEECQEWGRRMEQEKKELQEKQEQIRREELRKRGINPDTINQDVKPKYDSPYALDNGLATVLWLIVAIGALIFKGGWILSIVATVVWFNHITRHMDIDGGNE